MPPENLERFFFLVFSILIGLVSSASFLIILYFPFFEVTSFHMRMLLVAGFFVVSVSGAFFLSWTARDRWQDVPYTGTDNTHDFEQPIEPVGGRMTNRGNTIVETMERRLPPEIRSCV